MGHIATIAHTLPSGRTVAVKFVYESWIARIIIPHAAAITIWNRVYCRYPSLPAAIIRHELRHVEQWYALGPLRFLVEYLREWVLHGYTDNRFERDARTAESEKHET